MITTKMIDGIPKQDRGSSFRGKSFFVYADSVQEMGRFSVDETKRSPRWVEDSEWGSSSWFDRPDLWNMDDVAAAASQPWDDGLRRVLSILRDVQNESLPKPISYRRRQRWSYEDGDEVDLDRLRTGDPYWRGTSRETKRGPRSFSILCDIGARAYRTGTSILYRGAAAICLAKLLEESGYRVSIFAFRHSEGVYVGGDGFTGITRVKREGDPISIGTIASAVSAWFLRGVIFHASNAHTKTPKSGLGRAVSIRPVAHLAEPDPSRQIVVEGCWSHSSAVDLIRDTIKRLGLDQENWKERDDLSKVW